MTKTRQVGGFVEPSTPATPIMAMFDLDDPPADTAKSVRLWYHIDATAMALSSASFQEKMIVVRVIHDFYPDVFNYVEPRVYIPGGLPGQSDKFFGEVIIDNFINQHLRLEVLSAYSDDTNPIQIQVRAYQVD